MRIGESLIRKRIDGLPGADTKSLFQMVLSKRFLNIELTYLVILKASFSDVINIGGVVEVMHRDQTEAAHQCSYKGRIPAAASRLRMRITITGKSGCTQVGGAAFEAFTSWLT